jgi:hypothetical protein
MTKEKTRLFISYAHEDEAYKNRLMVGLAYLRRLNKIEIWEDRQIIGGQQWNEEIFQALKNAHLILMLVSDYFIASDFCFNDELKTAMQMADERKALVIPIIISPCNFSDLDFARLQALPKDAKPVNTWENADLAWQNVTEQINRSVEYVENGGLTR